MLADHPGTARSVCTKLCRRLIADDPPSAVIEAAVAVWIAGAYWFTSSTSFANPAATIARTLTDTFAGIEPASAPMFIVMELVGAAVAFALVRLLYPSRPSEGS